MTLKDCSDPAGRKAFVVCVADALFPAPVHHECSIA
jgi:hypothetical protein